MHEKIALRKQMDEMLNNNKEYYVKSLHFLFCGWFKARALLMTGKYITPRLHPYLYCLLFMTLLFIYIFFKNQFSNVLHPECSLPYLPALPHAPYMPPLFLFTKGQASHGYQPNIIYQVAVRLDSTPRINAE